MTQFVATVPTRYTINVILDKNGKPLIDLENFCELLDFTFADSFDFFDGLGKTMSSYWPEVGNYVEYEGSWYITVPQAYAFLPQADDLDRIGAALLFLETNLPKVVNQGEPD